MASYLNLRLREPFAYEKYEDGAIGWDITLNLQTVDDEARRVNGRLTAVEEAVAALGGSTGSTIDAGTF
jgi:hypothetical protein